MGRVKECLYCINLDSDENFEKWKFLFDIEETDHSIKKQIKNRDEDIDIKVSIQENASLSICKGNELKLIFGEDEFVVSKKIKYCPMCGRQLKEETWEK